MSPEQHAKGLEALKQSDSGFALASMLRGDVPIGEFQTALIGCIEEALSIMRAVQVGWQPISKAPKDAIILLGLPIAGNLREEDRRVYEGRWHEAQQTWTSVNGFILLTGATHWQPLPAPPTEHEVKP